MGIESGHETDGNASSEWSDAMARVEAFDPERAKAEADARSAGEDAQPADDRGREIPPEEHVDAGLEAEQDAASSAESNSSVGEQKLTEDQISMLEAAAQEEAKLLVEGYGKSNLDNRWKYIRTITSRLRSKLGVTDVYNSAKDDMLLPPAIEGILANIALVALDGAEAELATESDPAPSANIEAGAPLPQAGILAPPQKDQKPAGPLGWVKNIFGSKNT